MYSVIFLVEAIIEVEDSLCVAQRKRDGSDERAILFIKMAPGQEFNGKLEKKIRDRIRSDLSVRHVPAHILPIEDIPVSKRHSWFLEIFKIITLFDIGMFLQWIATWSKFTIDSNYSTKLCHFGEDDRTRTMNFRKYLWCWVFSNFMPATSFCLISNKITFQLCFIPPLHPHENQLLIF